MPRRRVREVINSTGRVRLRESDVSLAVSEDPPSVRITRIDLPAFADEKSMEAAEVWIEATQPRTASFDRWSLGTVGSIRGRSPVGHRVLKNFREASDGLFTVKIVLAGGRIVASSDDIRPDDQRAGEREALLQVRSQPLGELPWAVEFGVDGQTFLIVNSRIPAAETWIEIDPVASALVLPAAVRTVLTKLLADDGFRESGWGRAWGDWAATMSPSDMPNLEDAEDHEPWVEQTVAAFAEHHRLTGRAVAAMETKECDA